MGAHCAAWHHDPQKLMWYRASRALSTRANLPSCNPSQLCGIRACAPRRHLQRLQTFTSAASFPFTGSALSPLGNLLQRIDLQGTDQTHSLTSIKSISSGGGSGAMGSVEETPEIPMEVCLSAMLLAGAPRTCPGVHPGTLAHAGTFGLIIQCHCTGTWRVVVAACANRTSSDSAPPRMLHWSLVVQPRRLSSEPCTPSAPRSVPAALS